MRQKLVFLTVICSQFVIATPGVAQTPSAAPELWTDATRWLQETGVEKIVSEGGSVKCLSKAKASSEASLESMGTPLAEDGKPTEIGFKYKPRQDLQGFSLLIFRAKELVFCAVRSAHDNLPDEPGAKEEPEDDPASGGPPMIIDDTGTVDKGHWEVITAATAFRDSASGVAPTLDVNYGASEKVQLHVLVPWDFQKTGATPWVNGIADAELGFKYRFLGNANKGFSILTFPKADVNLGNAAVANGLVAKGTEYQVPIVVQQRFGKYTVAGEVGYDFRPTSKNQMLYGASAGYNANKRLQLLAEVVGNPDPTFAKNSLYVNIGNRVKLNKHTNLIYSAGRSILRPGVPGQYIVYVGIQTQK